MKNKFADKLLELMKEFNLSHEDIAKILDLSYFNTVYTWTNATKYPTLANLIKLADYFNCSLEYLLGRSEDDNTKKFKSSPNFYDRINEILKEKNMKKYHLIKAGICYPDNFQKWKNNSSPLIETVIKLAEYFNETTDYIVGRE